MGIATIAVLMVLGAACVKVGIKLVKAGVNLFASAFCAGWKS